MGTDQYTRIKELISFGIVIATTLLLTACGGGGTSNESNATTTPDIYKSVDDETNKIARMAAEANPTYGSVSQLFGASPNSQVNISRSNNGVYTITLPSAGSSDILLDTDENLILELEEVVIIDGVKVRPLGLYKENGDSATLVGVYAGDIDTLGNWLAGGWLHGADLAKDQPIFEIGAFIDGPEISSDPSLPTRGTAEYFGDATGIYVAIAGTDFYEEGANILGEYVGDFEANATFLNGGRTVSGKVIITGSDDIIVLRNSIDRKTNLVKDVSLIWDEVEFTSNGQATGDVTVSFPGLVLTENEGKTGNRFSVVSDSEGNPRLIAGTHGGSILSEGGTHAGFIGVHIGATGR